MPDYELTDTYWVENYWFADFLWWVIYSPSPFLFYKYYVNLEDRTADIWDERYRNYKVPAEARSIDA